VGYPSKFCYLVYMIFIFVIMILSLSLCNAGVSLRVTCLGKVKVSYKFRDRCVRYKVQLPSVFHEIAISRHLQLGRYSYYRLKIYCYKITSDILILTSESSLVYFPRTKNAYVSVESTIWYFLSTMLHPTSVLWV
jgi:hypothetical protein